LLSQVSDQPFILFEPHADRSSPLLRSGQDIFGQNMGHHVLLELIHGLDRTETFPVEDSGNLRERLARSTQFLDARYQPTEVSLLGVTIDGADDGVLAREATRPF